MHSGGRTVIVGEDVQVTINCSRSIEYVINYYKVTNPTVTWFKDEAVLTTGSTINVEISDDGRLCVITDTLLTVPSVHQHGNGGNYVCQVCRTPTICERYETCVAVCGE